MKPFAFVGKLPASKSILNRLLLAQSYFPAFKIHGASDCEDVEDMRIAISRLYQGQPDFDVGSAGTVLRFMALRASRVPGEHLLVGEKRLFQRPQDELIKILRQVGVQAELGENSLRIQGEGWKMQGDTLLVPSSRSSQFATSVLLNAWDLPFDLYVSPGGGPRVSEGYWRMSVEIAQQLGMKIDFWDADFRVPKGQKVLVQDWTSEIDMSSAFALAGVAAVNGQATFLEFPERSVQPDSGFVSILQSMGVPITRTGNTLKVGKAARLNGVAVNLSSTPDLFPVLAALCALAEGESDLFGAPHLVFKESNRLQRLADLLTALGRAVEVRTDGLHILGPRLVPNVTPVEFDCDSDHRLAFAAAVLKSAGMTLDIRHPEVVAKSFPEFWGILGWAN